MAGADRIVADVRGGAEGPTVVVVGGTHGNEPAGLAVCARLGRSLGLARGRLIALLGNAAGLAAGRRFVDEDLNRTFRAERVTALRDGQVAGLLETAELVEQRALLAVWDGLRCGERVLLDLHTFSGPGTPFAMAGPDPVSRELGRSSGLATLLGLERHLRGTMVELGALDGAPVLAIEGGQHADPRAAEVLAGAVLAILAALDLGPTFDGAAPRLPAPSPASDLLDIVHRHGLTAGDGFAMRAGYANLMPIRAGEHVADDHRGPILAPCDGLMVMPLYQGLGQDGFFIARPWP